METLESGATGGGGAACLFCCRAGREREKKKKTDGAATLKILKLGTCSWTSRSSGMEIAQSDNNERRCVRFPAEIMFVDGSLSANLSFSTPGFVFCVFIDIWFDPTVLKVCQVNVLAEIKVGRQLVCGCDSHWPTKMRFRTGSKGASYGRGRGKSLVRRWTVVMTDFNFAHFNQQLIDNLSAKLQALQNVYCCSVVEVRTSLTKIQKDASQQFHLILPRGNFYDHLAKTPVRFKQWEESALRQFDSSSICITLHRAQHHGKEILRVSKTLQIYTTTKALSSKCHTVMWHSDDGGRTRRNMSGK